MAISTSIDFAVTRDEIITEALELLGVLGEGESPNSDQISSMSRTLNALVKLWQADGLNLFAVQEQFLFPRKDQRKYALATNTGDHVTTKYAVTTVAAAVTSGVTTIELSDDVNVVVGDYVGIATSSTDVFWTTATTGTAGTTVELTDALPEDVDGGSTLFAYRTKAGRPMKVLEAYIRTGETDTPLGVISRQEYNRLSSKGTDGRVSSVYFDPQVGVAALSIWPETDTETAVLVLTVQKTLADLDSATDNPEVPQEWFLPLAYNLAVAAIPKYGTPQMDGKRIIDLATYYYNIASDFDIESETSLYFEPGQH